MSWRCHLLGTSQRDSFMGTVLHCANTSSQCFEINRSEMILQLKESGIGNQRSFSFRFTCNPYYREDVLDI